MGYHSKLDKVRNKRAKFPYTKEQIRNVFKRHDKNGDGQLSKDELMQPSKNLARYGLLVELGLLNDIFSASSLTMPSIEALYISNRSGGAKLGVLVTTTTSSLYVTPSAYNGAEYVNKVLHSYFQEHEILHETTCPYTPQQNGVDEGKNHQNFEITHASLRVSCSLRHHWTNLRLMFPSHLISLFLSHFGIGSIIARYCPFWAPLSALTVLFLGITSNFPVNSHDSEASELSKGLVLDGADNICAAPLSTTFPVPGPKSPHANILEEIAPCHEKYGYEQSNARHTLFLKRKNGKLTALIIYADDMIVTSDDLDEIGKLKGYFASEFDMKDLGGL
ncbi:hypothetical protein L3X38_007391 [Prunus dulcis]|uniref:EF-hand domain-containing protein n=1 Tax=Prunus dulcis TaxID=3755 RepID=A0AAD5F5V7_PRUDU|nr:hypothetical protein L3X38_007391 [Prunus dulcis]